jgi:CcmD family protein
LKSLRRRLSSGLLLLCLIGCPVAVGLAAAPRAYAQAQDDAAQDRAQSFRAVQGAVKEDVAGGPLMLAAYAVVWVAVFAYVFRMVRLQRGIEDNLARLERAVANAPAKNRD